MTETAKVDLNDPAPDLLRACNQLLILISMTCKRHDMPDEIRRALLDSEWLAGAKRIVARATSF